MKVIEMKRVILAGVIVLGLCGLAVGGSALEFDGVDDYVDVGDTVKNYLGGNYAVCAWIKTNTLSGNYMIASYRDTGGNSVLFQLDQIDTDARFIVRDEASNIAVATYYDAFTTDYWYYVVGVREGGSLTVYVNGTAGSPDSDTFGVINPNRFLIGSQTGSAGDFNGKIDEVGIYNRVLDVNEVGQIYHCGVFDDVNLVGYWGFEEGEGQVAYDGSAYGNDGTLIGGPAWVASEVPGVTYHVDVVDGDNGNDGLTKETAFASIQFGIDTAEDCDTVLVWPGVYNESLFFINKGITVQSAADAAELVASGIYGASLYTSEGPESVLKNFVIRDSDTGVYVSSGAPWLEHLTVVNCDLGIEAEAGAEPNIVNSILWNNAYDLFQCEAQYSWVEEEMEANLVAYWRFEEGSGTTAYDWVGDNDGTLTNGPVWTTGKVGSALEFDGSNDYVEVPDSESLDVTDDFAVGAWIKINSIPTSFGGIVNKSFEPGHYSLQFQPGTGAVSLHLFDGASYQQSGASRVLSLGTWYHVVGVYDMNSIRIYVNGQLDNYSSYSGGHIANNNPLIIGRQKDVSGRYIHGAIDEVGIWDRALSAEEIEQLYENGLAGHEYIDPIFADANGGDYHLKSERGRYWPEHDVWVLDEVSSPCIDAGDARVQPTGEPTANGGRINMGAYGNTAYASMSEWGLRSDFDYDGAVGLDDVGTFTDEWLEAVTYSQEPSGSALEFDGTDDYVRVPADVSLDFTRSYSISAWIKPVISPSEAMVWFGCHHSIPYGSIHLRCYVDGRLKFGLYSDDLDTAPGAVSLGSWNHVVVTYHYDSDSSAIYVDGILEASGNSGPYQGGQASATIGKWDVTFQSQQRFDGVIDEVGIYDRVVDINEIGQIYRCGIIDDVNLVGYWDFEEGEGLTAYDSSGYGNDGTLNGGAVWVESEVPGVTYHVDGAGGDNDNDGLTKETAFASIQFGIDTAEGCDTVLVWPGVYNESLFFINKGITVQSAAEAAKLTATGLYAASFYNFGAGDATLGNFVITDSDTGVYVGSGQPGLTNLTVVGNWMGVEAEASADPNINSCIFWDNDYDLFQCTASYSFVEEEISIPVSYWKLDGDANDSVGGNDGTLINGPVWTTGKVDGALDFDGMDDYVDCGSAVSLELGSFTISAWIKPKDISSVQQIAGKLGNEPVHDRGYGYRLEIRDGKASLLIDPAGGGNGNPIKSTTSLEIGQWYFVVGTYDGSTGTIYIDGQPENSDSWTLDAYYTNFYIGARRSDYHSEFFDHFSGVIDEVGIWDWALSEAEIERLFEDGLAGRGITVDPLFADANGGDYHLLSERGRYWLAEDVWVLDDVTSPCVDGGDVSVDPSGEPMPNGARVNMGAYGGTAYASMSEWPMAGDMDEDGIVNMVDYGILAEEWLKSLGWAE